MSRLTVCQECCIFHRWEKGSVYGYNLANIRQEAQHLLACANRDPEVLLVNGRASYGNPDETAEDDTCHTLCIAGRPDEGSGRFSCLLIACWSLMVGRLLRRDDKSGAERSERQHLACLHRLFSNQSIPSPFCLAMISFNAVYRCIYIPKLV